ncbi:bestrophin-like domain [Actinocatenispora rupis]|uniref:DUF4239 domain-containing protein n=1 Tax=Actinocatenispora rupis TaxID=519421 RepID=A0A8J3J7W4_9ACTN|nr:DUF4239 domain-containing protein [Actinocatenispora rupis]GID11023.1 hypothetical protein Aru02nite_19120 [Actinocatenispora rupis]
MSVYVHGALIIGGACVVAAVILLLVFRFGEHERRESNNDVNGLMFAIVGVLYAIVVGFVVTAQWENVGNARDAAAQEANGLVRLHWAAAALPADRAAQVRTLAQRYGTVVRDQEWPAMAAGRPVGPAGQRLLNQLAHAAQPPGDLGDTQAGDLSAGIGDVLQGRQQRLTLARQNLSGMMWFVLVAGGVLTVALAYLFGVPNRVAHLVMVVSLVGTVTLLLYACFQLQYPFGPATHLRPTDLTSALRLLSAST